MNYLILHYHMHLLLGGESKAERDERLTRKQQKFLEMKQKKKEKALEEETMMDSIGSLGKSDLHSLFWKTYIASQGGKLSKLETTAPSGM